MDKQKVLFSFFISLCVALFQSAIFPSMQLMAFAPFFIILLSSYSRIFSLWVCFFCGLLIDLFATTPLGLYSLNYCLCCFIFYRFRRQLFHEKPLNLSIFTAAFSFLSTFVHIFLLFIFAAPPTLSGKWIITDLFGMSAIDGLFAFIGFYCPIQLLLYGRKKLRFFLLKKRQADEKLS